MKQRCRALRLQALSVALLFFCFREGAHGVLPSVPSEGAVELAVAALPQIQPEPGNSTYGIALLRPISPMVSSAASLDLPAPEGSSSTSTRSAAGGPVRPPWQPGMQARTAPAPACSSLKGSLDECCNCSYEEVDQFNADVLYPTLTQLVATPFFRYFKVNLYCDCPLWPDDSMCAMRACSVCECSADELPKTWLLAESSSGAAQPTCGKKQAAKKQQQLQAASIRRQDSSASTDSDDSYLDDDDEEDSPASSSGGIKGREGGAGSQQEEEQERQQQEQEQGCDSTECAAESDSVVDRGVEPQVLEGLAHLKGWRGLNNPWMAEGEEDEDFLYINLVVNPERYTGYKGEHAHRIWSAIYNQSCFTEAGSQQCKETQLFYRLISGMHTSISAHIAAKYLLDEDQGLWGPSAEQFRQRLGTPVARERVKNLYFAYLFVLRAVSKAAPLLARFKYDTGLPEEDARTTHMVQNLLSRSELPASCFVPFEPSKLWQGDKGAELLATMQATFRNITRIMDCVGCEKCKLWGKLQTLGIATALKILFSSPDCDASASPAPALSAADGQPQPASAPPLFPGGLVLERNEVIALVNLLERFATSLHYYRSMDAGLSDPASKRAVAVADTVQ